MKTKRMIGTTGYAVRFAVLERDRFTCQYCGQMAPSVVLHVDHKIALADGGDNDLANLITACSACNLGKEGLRVQAFFATEQGRERSHTYLHRRTLADDIAKLIEQEPMDIAEIAEHLGKNRASIKTTLYWHKTVFSKAPASSKWGLVST